MTRSAVRLVLGMAAVMWALEIVDVMTGNALDALGIVPRTLSGLVGIAVAPFLHFGFGHLAANTMPFVVLGLLIALSGTARLVTVTVAAALLSGLGVWLLSPSSVTAGASGLVFGYAAYLVVHGIRSRRPSQILVALAVVVVFGGGLLAGLVPRSGVSWLGHVFGATAGGMVAGALPRGNATKRVSPLVSR